MTDNDPCHNEKRVTYYFEQTDGEVLEWPSLTPDLNQMEILWEIIGDKVGKPHPSTVRDL